MSRALIVLAIALLAGAGGYWAGENSWKIPRSPRPSEEPIEVPGLAREQSAELHRLLRMSPGADRLVGLRGFLDGLEPASFHDVQTLMRMAVVEADDPAYAMLADWYAAHDPQAAFRWSFGSWRLGNPYVLDAVVRRWVDADPDAAAQGVERLPHPEARLTSRRALVRAWYRSGKPGLEDYLLRIADTADRQLALGQLVYLMSYLAGVEQTIAWAESLPDADSDFKQDAFRRVASFVAEVDPRAALDFAARHGEGDFGHAVYRRAAMRWVEMDASAGEAAMEWLRGLPAGERRDAGVQETFRVWLGGDREAALAYVDERGFGGWLEPAASLYLMASARIDPQRASAQIDDIEDPVRRREATIGVGRAWIKDDPEAVARWMDEQGFDPQTREWIASPSAFKPRR